ncbi:YHS domain-containing protein [Candidatus Woesearchaeota archaeon]|nr:YHS domain-containing protein [Candidatus Woesearchaeota archaeon]
MFGLFAKKDPVCGMKREKGKGIEKDGKWFCSEACVKKFETGSAKAGMKSGSCCGGH